MAVLYLISDLNCLVTLADIMHNDAAFSSTSHDYFRIALHRCYTLYRSLVYFAQFECSFHSLYIKEYALLIT